MTFDLDGYTAIVGFSLVRPSDDIARQFRERQEGLPFSYYDVGVTRDDCPPDGYTVDHNRICLGKGEAAYQRAKDALRAWTMFALGWISVLEPDTPLEPGRVVTLRAHHYGFWSLHAARIVYIMSEIGPDACRFGFAYGTLPDHAERGEERFSVEWRVADDSVWYDLLAYSYTGLWATLGYPLARRLQKRFAADSLRAMQAAVRAGE